MLMASSERKTRTAGLDGLRAVAALSVLCLHVWLYGQPNPDSPTRSGVLDRAVFELIHYKQNEWVVVNYDAHAAHDFSQAFGQQAPTAHDLASGLSDRATEAEVDAVLMDLVRRGIVDTDNRCYWIRF